MSVHLEVILDAHKTKQKQTYNYYLYSFSHRTVMNNRFDNISDNISVIQNISYIVVSIQVISNFLVRRAPGKTGCPIISGN